MTKLMDDLEVFNTEDLSKMLGVHKVTVHRWFRSGRLQGSKVGKWWTTTGESLRAFLQDGTGAPVSQYLRQPRKLFGL